MFWIVGRVWPPRNLPLGLMSYLGDLVGLLQCHPLPNCRPKILTLWWDPFPEELGAQYLIIFKLVQYEVIVKFHPEQSTDVWVIVHVNKRTIKTGPELMVYPRHRSPNTTPWIGVGVWRLVVVNETRIYCRTWSHRWIIDIAPGINFGLWAPHPLGTRWTMHI